MPNEMVQSQNEENVSTFALTITLMSDSCGVEVKKKLAERCSWSCARPYSKSERRWEGRWTNAVKYGWQEYMGDEETSKAEICIL